MRIQHTRSVYCFYSFARYLIKSFYSKLAFLWSESDIFCVFMISILLNTLCFCIRLHFINKRIMIKGKWTEITECWFWSICCFMQLSLNSLLWWNSLFLLCFNNFIWGYLKGFNVWIVKGLLYIFLLFRCRKVNWM